MKYFWENDGAANQQGEFVAHIDPEDGKTRPQRFIGKTHKEVADQLMQAQANASAKIAEQNAKLRSQIQPDPEPPAPTTAQERPLSADDRLRLTTALGDAARAPEAVIEIVERKAGVPLKTVGQQLTKEQLDEMVEKAKAATVEFLRITPDYYPCESNNRKLTSFLEGQRKAVTVNSLQWAFNELREDGLLIQKPEETEKEPVPEEAEREQQSRANSSSNARTTRQRGEMRQSGHRNSDFDGSRPTPSAQYTWAQVEAMSDSKFDELYATDPAFKKFVDTVPRGRVAAQA